MKRVAVTSGPPPQRGRPRRDAPGWHDLLPMPKPPPSFPDFAPADFASGIALPALSPLFEPLAHEPSTDTSVLSAAIRRVRTAISAFHPKDILLKTQIVEVFAHYDENATWEQPEDDEDHLRKLRGILQSHRKFYHDHLKPDTDLHARRSEFFAAMDALIALKWQQRRRPKRGPKPKAEKARTPTVTHTEAKAEAKEAEAGEARAQTACNGNLSLRWNGPWVDKTPPLHFADLLPNNLLHEKDPWENRVRSLGFEAGNLAATYAESKIQEARGRDRRHSV